MREAEFLIEAMAVQLRELLARRGIVKPALVGIHTGGVWIAERLRQRLDLTTPLGQLDIAFYRDDFSRIGIQPQVRPSELPFDVDGRHLVLVDDVIHTGRTIRAALNELFDYGRPASIVLAVLVDRGGRELPIEANVAGSRLELPADQQIQLTGPDPLQLHIQTIP
ncbi:MAG: bifunctional pyr operon transcriptional regulator/uracil phosphoribosyltransferase PyrR [Candidatus Competibacter sp.]|nr:bifunctional pyr operon transcriptional regulator/uracil phosphoribosyltransferase PyrR [Candidatus Competibacter sp.]MDG4605501.1 bifunctional pyr operon transcriptional regulator/uracil phosphoribosyltransferase PyrR [Candidatus Contendobacter sp.]HRD49667.1 bifunctional pyr operon transcriptional regulator/uracil phosphoribosyltransferase PyrR [Candidatus Contendobacter sp.]